MTTLSFAVLKRPIITEKSTEMHEGGRYVFEVDTRATKHQIKWAVEDAFDVGVSKVNTMNVKGKRKRSRSGRFVTARAWKKAVVKLHSGDSITIFEGV